MVEEVRAIGLECTESDASSWYGMIRYIYMHWKADEVASLIWCTAQKRKKIRKLKKNVVAQNKLSGQ